MFRLRRRLSRSLAMTAGAVVLGALAVGLIAPSLVAAQESDATPTDGAWSELTAQACTERVDNAEAPRMTDFLEELVADGVIDQSQADEIESRLRERGEDACVGMILYQPGQAINATADATSTEPRDVLRALRDGATLADYAAQYGVSEEQLVDAIMADSEAKAAELVASGELEQARADELLLSIEERVTEGIHNTKEDRARPWRDARERIGDVVNALHSFVNR